MKRSEQTPASWNEHKPPPQEHPAAGSSLIRSSLPGAARIEAGEAALGRFAERAVHAHARFVHHAHDHSLHYSRRAREKQRRGVVKKRKPRPERFSGRGLSGYGFFFGTLRAGIRLCKNANLLDVVVCDLCDLHMERFIIKRIAGFG